MFKSSEWRCTLYFYMYVGVSVHYVYSTQDGRYFDMYMYMHRYSILFEVHTKSLVGVCTV